MAYIILAKCLPRPLDDASVCVCAGGCGKSVCAYYLSQAAHKNAYAKHLPALAAAAAAAVATVSHRYAYAIHI